MRRAEPRPIAGRAVAITGAARGIGLAIAEALAVCGARVALGDLDGEEAERRADALGHGAVGLPLDVTSSDSFRGFLDAAEHELGPLDVLVNNAGVMWVGPFADEPEEAARRQLEVNLHGPIRGMKLAVPRMRSRRRGHVVTVASAASKLAPAGEATYAATKHGIYGYCFAAREELRGTGVELSVVMPVVVETELAAGTAEGKGRRLRPEEVADAVVAALEHPRFEVWVPRSTAAFARVLTLLPQALRDRVYRATVPDQIRDTDRAARAAYERRSVAP